MARFNRTNERNTWKTNKFNTKRSFKESWNDYDDEDGEFDLDRYLDSDRFIDNLQHHVYKCWLDICREENFTNNIQKRMFLKRVINDDDFRNRLADEKTWYEDGFVDADVPEVKETISGMLQSIAEDALDDLGPASESYKRSKLEARIRRLERLLNR